jgi:prepilin-type N-terminal cleavage/methylation domain-containing protein
MKQLEKKVATTSTSSINASGFTLIELLVVVGIIAILIGLLLPAIQKAREEYTEQEATANINQLAAAANAYRQQTGAFPQSLTNLLSWCASHSGQCSLNPQLASGKVNGYLYDIVEHDQSHCLIEAEPESPGIDGALTMRLTITLENTMVSSFQTPGADAARERMFNNIRLKAAETVVALFNLDGSAIPQAREYCESPATATNVYQLIDADDDGTVNINEVFSGDAYVNEMGLKAPLRQFLDYVAQEMKWDNLSETAKINVRVDSNPDGDERTARSPLFSYDGLGILTATAMTDGTSNTLLLAELLDKLEAAEAAEASGNLQGKMKALESYQKRIKSLVGQCFTRSNSKMLITLSTTL